MQDLQAQIDRTRHAQEAAEIRLAQLERCECRAQQNSKVGPVCRLCASLIQASLVILNTAQSSCAWRTIRPLLMHYKAEAMYSAKEGPA